MRALSLSLRPKLRFDARLETAKAIENFPVSGERVPVSVVSRSHHASKNTECSGSTTASSSTPIRQVPTPW